MKQRSRTLGLGALGRAVSELRYIRWLATTQITYWGDLDIEENIRVEQERIPLDDLLQNLARRS